MHLVKFIVLWPLFVVENGPVEAAINRRHYIMFPIANRERHAMGQELSKDACYDRGIPFFGKSVFRMTGLLNPEMSGKKGQFSCMLLAVYPGRGDFSSCVAVLFLSKSVYGTDILNSQIEEKKKNVARTSIYRSTRPSLFKISVCVGGAENSLSDEL